MSEVEPFNPMLGAPKALAMTGGPITVTDAVAGLLVPPLVEVTDTMLVFTPIVVPVTLTLKVQDPAKGNVAPDKLTLVEPAVAVIVPFR